MKARSYATWSTVLSRDGTRGLWFAHVIELDRHYDGSSPHEALAKAAKAIEHDAKRPYTSKQQEPHVRWEMPSERLDAEYDAAVEQAKKMGRP